MAASSSSPASYFPINPSNFAATTPATAAAASAAAASVTPGVLASQVGTINALTGSTGFTPTTPPSTTASASAFAASSGSTVSTSSAISGSGASSLAGTPPPPRNLTLSPIDINSSLGVQLGSHANLFEVSFSGFPLSLRRTSSSFVTNTAGLLCHNAVLPGTSFGTAEIYGAYQQVYQKYAHTRIYPTISLTFYEDRSYKMITFFEDWQNFMTVTGTSSVNAQNYFYRMRYPNEYKCDTMFITKFEKNYGLKNNNGPLLQYQFLKIFPINMSSIPVSYGDTDIMKVTVEFAYDRYLMKNNGIGSDDGLRPSQTQQLSPTGFVMTSAASAPGPTGTIDDRLAAWALSNQAMITNQTVTSSGNYLQDQKDILAAAQANYPPGSPQLAALRAKYKF